jgi:(p)ppGpp synthase/HD superfamily hydrolase
MATVSDRYRDALGFAFDLHRAQLRKASGVPYVAHVLGVSSLVMEYGGDEEEAIAALLHDAVEDQGGLPMLETIRARFGDRVAEIVLGCSDSVAEPKPPWRGRKERYLEHLRTASRSVKLVSSCDKLYNARTIVADLKRDGESVWSRFTGGKEGTVWYYRALANLFADVSDLPSADELRRVVDELESLSRDAPTGGR